MIFGRLSSVRRIGAALLAPLILLLALILLGSCTFALDYDKYAIVYGVSDYPAGYNDLTSTDDDARDMEVLLSSQGFQVVLRITDDTGTNDAHDVNLLADFNFAATSANLGLDDLFLFYFSGHGSQIPPGSPESTPGTDSDDEAILLVSDAPPISRTVVYLTDDELAGLVRTIPCARRVVILDACYSGGFISNPLDADAIPPDFRDGANGIFETLGNAIYLYANFEDYGSDIPPSDALVIAASGEQDVAYEIENQNGVMTYYLMKSATEGDFNRDGYITVSEAYFYTYKNINKHFNMIYGSSGHVFFPHISGGPVDYVLFTDY